MNCNNFGENLKHLRKSREMTQQDLGSKLGLSKAVVSKYENGIGYPSFDILVRIAKFFGVSTDYLLGVMKGKTVDVSELTENQIIVIHQLVEEFKGLNKRDHTSE